MRVARIVRIGKCKVDRSAEICGGAIIGKPFRRLLDESQETPNTTIVAQNVYIGYGSIVGAGSEIGDGTIIDDQCVVESRVVIGRETLIIYRAQVCNGARIGNKCVIGGLVAERTVVGDNCRVFGKIVHSQHNPLLGWDDDNAMEDSATIKDGAFIGFGAVVVGNITIGRKVYVCVNAVVSKDVPDLHIASGINEIVHFSKWKGRLRASPFFLDSDD